MHPSSRRVGPTSARNSASSKGSCPTWHFSNTINVTASFDSFPSLNELRFRELLLPVLRLPADFFPARLAIVAGIVPQPAQNATDQNALPAPTAALSVDVSGCGRVSRVNPAPPGPSKLR